MEAKRKNRYETPSTMVVEVKYEGIVCSSPGPDGVMWFLDGSSFSSNQDWGRDGYGNAEDF